MQNLKIKPLDKNQLKISIDRLTRFKNTQTKYLRVYKDVIIHNLIYPKYSKNDLDILPFSDLKNIAQEVINYSINLLCTEHDNNFTINKKLYEYETGVFEASDECKELLKNNINYFGILSILDNSCPKNLLWLKSLAVIDNQKETRQKYSLLFPIEKVILVEGATEEVLLPEFGRICGYDFDKNGVQIISAGGKNQVVRLYYELSETLKLPIFVLLDKDGHENALEIDPRLRKQDKIHLLECGEFEDLLPISLVKRTLEYELQNISLIEQDMIKDSIPRAQCLEEIFKNRGMHEFKKVEFAQMVKRNISYQNDISPEIKNIIEEIQYTKNGVA